MIRIPENSVIPSIRRLQDVEAAIASPCPLVLLSNVHIGNLEALACRLREADKRVVVHADLLGGFRPDREGIKLLKNMYRLDGVFSQSSQVVSAAQKCGLWAVQRVFLMDSRSLERSLEILAESHPDGIEVLPGVLASRFSTLFARWDSAATLMAGGMIASADDADTLFARGYRAITASSTALWK